jgi:hypothetical protein
VTSTGLSSKKIGARDYEKLMCAPLSTVGRQRRVHKKCGRGSVVEIGHIRRRAFSGCGRASMDFTESCETSFDWKSGPAICVCLLMPAGTGLRSYYGTGLACGALKIRFVPRNRIARDMNLLSCLLARKARNTTRTEYFWESSLVLINGSYKHNPQCKNYLIHYQN